MNCVFLHLSSECAFWVDLLHTLHIHTHTHYTYLDVVHIHIYVHIYTHIIPMDTCMLYRPTLYTHTHIWHMHTSLLYICTHYTRKHTHVIRMYTPPIHLHAL